MLVASVVVLVALAGGVAYLLLRDEDRYPSSWDDRVASLAEWTAQARGLEFEHPVKVNFLTDSEYTAATRSERTADEAEELAYAAAELRALGLASGDLDLADSVDTLSDSGTLAFYSPATEQVYVRGLTLTPAMRVTLVHELVHVLQDQHFDLSRTQTADDGRATVLRAVAEGDAGRIEDVYVDEVLTDAERAAYGSEAAGQSDVVDMIRDEVPDAVTAMFAAPYLFGESLVAYLVEVEGVDAVDEALRDPPSEEVLFNPHLWNAPEAEELSVEVAAPDGVVEIRSDRFGPISWYLVLAARLEPSVALRVVDGFGGDSFVSYRDGGRVCVRMTVVGDDEAATETFEEALGRWVDAGPPELSSVERDDDLNLRFQACDPGADGPATDPLRLEVLGLPVTRTTVFTEVRNFGSTEAVAWCVTDALVSQITLEDLVEPSAADQGDLVEMMTTAMSDCAA